jgi:hypothetical protein
VIWDINDEPLPSITAHLKKLRSMACVVSGRKENLTLHHARGGSMAMTPLGTPGGGRKQLDALQIPLNIEWHVGKDGIDCRVNSGVVSWEARWGRQVDHLNSLCVTLGYSVWKLALEEAKAEGRYITVRRVENFLLQQPFLFLRLPTTSTDIE